MQTIRLKTLTPWLRMKTILTQPLTLTWRSQSQRGLTWLTPGKMKWIQSRPLPMCW